MEYHDLQKTRVADLRDMVKEKMPEVQGVIGMKKEQIVDLLAEHLGIEKPHKHVASAWASAKIKAEIRELKQARQAALEAGDQAELKKQRRLIHRRKRRLRRLMQLLAPCRRGTTAPGNVPARGRGSFRARRSRASARVLSPLPGPSHDAAPDDGPRSEFRSVDDRPPTRGRCA